MKILLIIGLALAAGLAILLALAAAKPDTFRVTRTARIQAPPETIIPLIADFHRWAAWSPWEKLDPAMTRAYGGPPQGVGATYAWSSKGKAGEGDMKITEVTASRVLIDLNFTKPMKAQNTTEFALAPIDGGTQVTWTMDGRNPFLGKVMHVLFDFDKMVGADFEKGLADMKAAAEAR